MQGEIFSSGTQSYRGFSPVVNCSVHIKADVAGGTQRRGSTRKMLVAINKTLPKINVRLKYLKYCLIIAMGFIYQTQ
jgi:hypothetical protein